MTGARQPATGAPPKPNLFPLKLSANGRYLLSPSGLPFPLFLESGWEHARMLIPSGREYLDDLGPFGFTAVLNQGVITLAYRSGIDAGSPYFNATVSAGVYDITQPNSTAFANIRAALQYASQLGICSFYYPAYLGFAGASPVEGILDALQAATGAQCETYGAYVGSLIADIPGIIIALGGDQIPNSTDLEKVRRMTVGIRSTDMPGRIYTWHGARTQQAYGVDAVTVGYVAALNVPFLDTAYSREYGTVSMTHFQCLNSYALTRPVQTIEGAYEGSAAAIADGVLLRRQFFGSWLSGGLGSSFGDEVRYLFNAGWQTTLTRPGLAQEAYCIAFLKARAWWRLIPSTGTGMVTSGGGTVNTLTYKPRAAAQDGSWGACHVVDGTATTIDFSVFSSTKTVKWFDPSLPLSAANPSIVGSHGNSGTQAYTPSGNNSVGATDWVLVIE